LSGSDRLFRRRLWITSGAGLAVAELSDNAHHFRVGLHHDGTCVREVVADSIRYPWSTCPGADSRLEELRGMPLEARSTAVGAHSAAREHCTHMFDLAGLAVAHAAREGDSLIYDCTVGDDGPDRLRATLDRDGERLLDWQIRRNRIEEPEPFVGVRLHGGGFIAWAEEQLEPELAEAAIVLRRAVYVSPSRHHDLDAFERPSDMPREPGACHTFSEGTKQLALRMKGSQRDFSEDPHGPLPMEDPACSS
jgi:hypothetical protein